MRNSGPLSNPSRGLSFHPGWVYGISKISPIRTVDSARFDSDSHGPRRLINILENYVIKW